MAAALATAAALGSPSASAAADTKPALELRRVLLSSGGVGYFEYEATLQGAADLPFSVRLDQVDDVLKSLVVYDDAGNLGSVSLPGKELARDAFRDLPISRDALGSPAALLSALRGTEVRVEAAGSLVIGRIVSVTEEQKKGPNNEIITQHRLSLLSEGALRQVVVEQIDSLKVLDETLQTQLNAALDALAGERERERRELTIHIGGTGERTVRVGYVAEVPLWKSTYRLVLPASPTDKAALTGFAVVENRSGEDWNDVELTLVSGNPVTFKQAIYDTYYVTRPTVPVEVLGRVLPRVDEGGVTLAPEMAVNEEAASDASLAYAPAYAAPAYGGYGGGGFGMASAKRLAHRAMNAAAITAAPGSEQASQVVFKLANPVTLASGQTDLLPVISLLLPAERVSLYQPETDARHPLSSVQITNDSTTDLPPGVLALYEREPTSGAATYAGDAQLPLIPAGKTRFISYAVDLRVTVDSKDKDDQKISVATIVDGTLKLTQSYRKTTIYTVAGDANQARTVILERPRVEGYTLLPSTDFTVKEATSTDHRLQIQVPAGKTVTVTVVLEKLVDTKLLLADIGNDQLGVYADSADVPAKVREGLRRIIGLRAVQAAKETTLAQRTTERAKILEDQGRLRENLKAVPAGSDLAKKYLVRLATQEDRLAALDGEIIAAEAAVAAAREAVAAEIRALRA
jgi:hypothetical protein